MRLSCLLARVSREMLIDYLEAGQPLSEFLEDFPRRRIMYRAKHSRWPFTSNPHPTFFIACRTRACVTRKPRRANATPHAVPGPGG